MKRKIFVIIVPITVTVVFAISLSIGDAMFTQQIKADIERLFAVSENISNTTFTYKQSIGLPEPVQRYFRYSIEEGKQYLSYVKLKHNGVFRQNEGQEWMNIEGQEYFTTVRPGFVWTGKITPFALFWITGKDTYIEGKANFQIKLLSLLNIVNERNSKELDESELQRWLAEAPWFPTSLLPSRYLHWEEIDENSARAVVEDDSNGLTTATAIFHFNEKGEIVEVNADRYRSVDNKYSKQKWIGYYRDYKKIEGMMIPNEIEVGWRSSSKDFSYAKFRITEIIYDDPSKY